MTKPLNQIVREVTFLNARGWRSKRLRLLYWQKDSLRRSSKKRPQAFPPYFKHKICTTFCISLKLETIFQITLCRIHHKIKLWWWYVRHKCFNGCSFDTSNDFRLQMPGDSDMYYSSTPVFSNQRPVKISTGPRAITCCDHADIQHFTFRYWSK